MKNELEESVVIELRNPATDFARSAREALINAEQELSQCREARRVARGIAAAAILSTLMILALAFVYGCTFAVTVDAPGWSGAAADGGEPMGWEDSETLERELRR